MWWMYLCNGGIQWLSTRWTHLLSSFLIRMGEAER